MRAKRWLQLLGIPGLVLSVVVALALIGLLLFSLYNGTDISSTTTVTPGYKLDFPGTAGNCATCHVPGAAANRPFTADMNDLTGVETEGVLCDFCRKVSGVYLNPATGLPYPNMPGVQSMQLNRPPTDTHMFYGPFDNVTRRVSYLELEKKSQCQSAPRRGDRRIARGELLEAGAHRQRQPHRAAKSHLNKLRIPHCLLFFSKIMKEQP